jgi:hypothetical protein
MMRHGYYVARTEQEHGDAELSAEARLIWHREWSEEKPIREVHEDGQAGPVDGVSIFDREDGKLVRRLILHGAVRDVEPCRPPERPTSWKRILDDD